YLSIMDPINFVAKIAPRSLLMINASKDDIVPPMMTKAMYRKAKEPKKIIWYPTKHRKIPLDKAFSEAVGWFKKYL
ncbi:MAG: alpha/beta hydrolase, partial [Calditrichaeota bacterium]|nr:alpha/beta hydrolase [Calditrichota bacterium]